MTTTAHSDAELLAQAREGDEAAFTELYVRHHAAARRLAAGYPRAGDPDDLVNGAFERVLGALRRGSGPTEAFRAYLFVTLRRLATDQIARTHDDPVDDVPEPIRAEEQQPPLDQAERHLVIAAYESLPERSQAVLWQTEVEGRQPRELGGLLGMSANAAAALAYRAREKLRQAYLQAHLQAAPRPQCEPHRSRLGAYIREGLGNRDQTATATHLEGCEHCQSLVVELLDVNRLLRRGLVPLFETTAGQFGAAAAVATGAAAGGGLVALGGRLASKLKSNGAVVAGVAALAAAVAFALVATQSDEQTLLPGASPESPEPPPSAAPDEPAATPAPSMVDTPEEAAAPEPPPPASEPEPARLPSTTPSRPGLPAPGPIAPPRPPTSPPSTTPPVPPTTPPQPPPALIVVWVDIQGTLQITLTNNTGRPTDGLLVEVDLVGGAVVGGPPANCGASLSRFTTVSCRVGSLTPGEHVVVRVPLNVTAAGQSASTRTCETPVLGLVCLDVVARTTTALGL